MVKQSHTDHKYAFACVYETSFRTMWLLPCAHGIPSRQMSATQISEIKKNPKLLKAYIANSEDSMLAETIYSLMLHKLVVYTAEHTLEF